MNDAIIKFLSNVIGVDIDTNRFDSDYGPMTQTYTFEFQCRSNEFIKFDQVRDLLRPYKLNLVGLQTRIKSYKYCHEFLITASAMDLAELGFNEPDQPKPKQLYTYFLDGADSDISNAIMIATTLKPVANDKRQIPDSFRLSASPSGELVKAWFKDAKDDKKVDTDHMDKLKPGRRKLKL